LPCPVFGHCCKRRIKLRRQPAGYSERELSRLGQHSAALKPPQSSERTGQPLGRLTSPDNTFHHARLHKARTRNACAPPNPNAWLYGVMTLWAPPT
jgi:hypothetical protein